MNRLPSLCALALLAAASCNSYQPRWSTNPTFNNPVGSLALALAQDGVTLLPPTANSQSPLTATVDATLTPADGFTGLVQFTPVLDKLYGLVITPESIDVEGTAPVTVTLTFTSDGTVAAGEDIIIAASASNQSAEAALHVESAVPARH